MLKPLANTSLYTQSPPFDIDDAHWNYFMVIRKCNLLLDFHKTARSVESNKSTWTFKGSSCMAMESIKLCEDENWFQSSVRNGKLRI